MAQILIYLSPATHHIEKNSTLQKNDGDLVSTIESNNIASRFVDTHKVNKQLEIPLLKVKDNIYWQASSGSLKTHILWILFTVFFDTDGETNTQ